MGAEKAAPGLGGIAEESGWYDEFGEYHEDDGTGWYDEWGEWQEGGGPKRKKAKDGAAEGEDWGEGDEGWGEEDWGEDWNEEWGEDGAKPKAGAKDPGAKSKTE